jgi:hypothetical protein
VAGSIVTPVQAADVSNLGEVRELESASPWIELGATGLKRAAGYIDEEFLPHLKGPKAVKIYREMGDNDPITGAMLFSIQQLLRGVEWTVEPGGKSKADMMAAKLVETCMEDMSSSWDGTMMEVLSCLRYGWSWHEIVYKRRVGPWEKDPTKRSKHTDGLVGWRKMPIRSQETLLRWIFDETGDVAAMVQMAAPDYQTRILPLDRSLLFRFGHVKNNPEGFSILRTSYRPWYYKKRIEELESVGIERDLAGLPMVTVPTSYLSAAKGSEQGKMVEGLRKMVRSVRRNEQEGVIFPIEYDQDTKQKLFEFTLLNSGGARQHNTDAIIRRYEERQLMTILADFIMVGHQSTGTYNLHVDKTGIFREALNATARNIAEVFNRHAIPRLFAANGWRLEDFPKIVPSNVDAPDLAQLSQFLTSTAGLGFSWGPDADMEKFLRNAAGLPDLAPEELEIRRKEGRVDDAARYAEQQTRYMAARSQLVQAQAAEQAMLAGQPTPEMQAQSQQLAQGQQGMEQGKQQMAITAAGEERAAADHAVGLSERVMTSIGDGGEAKKKPVKKMVVRSVRR